MTPSDDRGKVVVRDWCASWYGPTIAEDPHEHTPAGRYEVRLRQPTLKRGNTGRS